MKGTKAQPWPWWRTLPADVGQGLDRIDDRHVRPFLRIIGALMEERPPIERTPEAWMRVTGMRTVGQWVRCRDALIASGHITSDLCGRISAPWAEREWAHRTGVSSRNAVAGQKGGRARSSSGEKNLEPESAPSRQISNSREPSRPEIGPQIQGNREADAKRALSNRDRDIDSTPLPPRPLERVGHMAAAALGGVDESEGTVEAALANLPDGPMSAHLRKLGEGLIRKRLATGGTA